MRSPKTVGIFSKTMFPYRLDDLTGNGATIVSVLLPVRVVDAIALRVPPMVDANDVQDLSSSPLLPIRWTLLLTGPIDSPAEEMYFFSFRKNHDHVVVVADVQRGSTVNQCNDRFERTGTTRRKVEDSSE